MSTLPDFAHPINCPEVQRRWASLSAAQRVEEVATKLLGWYAGPYTHGAGLWWIAENGDCMHPVLRTDGEQTHLAWNPVEDDGAALTELRECVRARMGDRGPRFRVCFEQAIREVVTARLKRAELLPMRDAFWLLNGRDFCLACLVADERAGE